MYSEIFQVSEIKSFYVGSLWIPCKDELSLIQVSKKETSRSMCVGREVFFFSFFFHYYKTVELCWKKLPILKESGPPEVLLTHMAKKSRSAQAVSIFYDSSWVLPRGCPCHSHLKNRSTETTLLNINRHRDARKQDEAVRQTAEPADNTHSLSHSLLLHAGKLLVRVWNCCSVNLRPTGVLTTFPPSLLLFFFFVMWVTFLSCDVNNIYFEILALSLSVESLVPSSVGHLSAAEVINGNCSCSSFTQMYAGGTLSFTGCLSNLKTSFLLLCTSMEKILSYTSHKPLSCNFFLTARTQASCDNLSYVSVMCE